MLRPHTKIPEKPNKFCSICKREVYETIHTANSYCTDWYGTKDKPICVDCFPKHKKF